MVKAGEEAPEIDWSSIVRSPDGGKFTPVLKGRYTVLRFLGPVTVNKQAVARWNALVAAFRDQPVQFIWIAWEPWAKVEPSLEIRPIESWLLIDETRETARLYGFEESGGEVILDPSGKIVGFTQFLQPDQLAAVLAGNEAQLDKEPPPRREPFRGEEKPDIHAAREVRIYPSTTHGTDGSAGPDWWVQRGFGLKEMIAMVYETDELRVEMPESLEKGKFDFVGVFAEAEERNEVHRMAQKAIAAYFNLSISVETKLKDVYVMTGIEGKMPPKTGEDGFGGGMGSAMFDLTRLTLPTGTARTPEAIQQAMEALMKHPDGPGITSLSAMGTDMHRLRDILQRCLARPIVDETGLTGTYDVVVESGARNTEEFLRRLTEATGIVLTRATRSVEIVIAR